MLKELISFKKARYRVAQRVRLFNGWSIFSVFETLLIDSFHVKMQKFLHFYAIFAVFETHGVSNCGSKAGVELKFDTWILGRILVDFLGIYFLKNRRQRWSIFETRFFAVAADFSRFLRNFRNFYCAGSQKSRFLRGARKFVEKFFTNFVF